MTGMWRNDSGGHDHDGIERLEQAESRDAPPHLMGEMDCKDADWWGCFDNQGWCKCGEGYYMRGLYRSDDKWLRNIEQAKCCRPKKQEKKWGHCYEQDVSRSFDGKGWSKCNNEYYMAGIYRENCKQLYCLEKFWCCKMGNTKAFGWPEGKCTTKEGMALPL